MTSSSVELEKLKIEKQKRETYFQERVKNSPLAKLLNNYAKNPKAGKSGK